MTAFKSLVIQNGTNKQISDEESLLVGTGIDRSTAGDLTIGGTTATSITLGSATIPVNIPGDVTTVGGTTFTTDATFEGNVTFGNAGTDTVDFIAKVDSDIEFAAPGYKIVNLADGVEPTDAVNKSQLDAVTTPPGGPTNSIQTNDGADGFAGSANLLWDGTAVAVSDGASTLSIDKSSISTTAAALDLEGASSVTATITGGATYLLTPNSVQTIEYAASVALDFDPALPALKTVALTGDIAFTSSGLGASRNVSVRVVGDTVSRNLTSFPAGWKWLGGAAPTVLEANKVAILSLASFSNNDANVVASWSYDGSDVVTDVTASGPLASSGGATPDISFPSWPADASGALTNDGEGNLSWAPDEGGTVTSVDLSTTLSGITVGGNPITTSGTLTLSGTLGAASGGTGATTLTGYVSGNGTSAFTASATIPGSDVSGDISGNAANVTGTVAVDHGGTGATTLTGYVSGNGTSAFTASATIPGSDVSGDISGNAANVTGTVAVDHGGTGATSLTSGSLLAGNGTGAVAEIAPGTDNQVLTVVGGAWAAASLPAATDYSVAAIDTAQAANTAVTVAGAAAQANAAANARVAGIVKAANSVQVLGIVTCIIESTITVAKGDVVYLSASEAGKVTKTAPGAGVIAELGIATASGSGAGGTVAVLWQPKSITVL